MVEEIAWLHVVRIPRGTNNRQAGMEALAGLYWHWRFQHCAAGSQLKP